jgi:carotenoid cleavage dioxygenase-like enzyme
MFELDRSSLECISRHDPVKELGIHCQSSHPLIDQKTGYTYNIGISLFSGAKWSVLRFPPGCSKLAKDSIKKCEIITTFACRNKISFPWLHSFGMSQNYLICIDQPSFFNVSKVISSIFSNGICPKDVSTSF